MFLKVLNRYKLLVLPVIFSILMISGLQPLSYSDRSEENNQNPGETFILNSFFSANLSGPASVGEKKPASNSELVLIIKLQRNDISIVRSVAHSSSFNNETIINFRLHSFITSHFATST